MISPVEVEMQRRLTKAFIEADVTPVVLVRTPSVPDGAGGQVEGTPAPLPPQRMRLIPLGDGAQERFDANGQSVRPSYKLLGLYTADMERWDTFVLNGSRYEIVWVNQNRQYEVKGEVAYRG